MMNPFRSEQSNERNAFAQNMNPMMQMKMMDLLRSIIPEESRPATFQDALKGGQFDTNKIQMMMEMMRRRHAPPESMDSAGSSVFGGGMM